jgi:hypothetical protein
MSDEWVVDTWINELALSTRRQKRRGGPGSPRLRRPREATYEVHKNVRQTSNKCYTKETIGPTYYRRQS